MDNGTVQIFLKKDRDLSYGNASGMIVDLVNRKFVLTVAHVLPPANFAKEIQPVAFVDYTIRNGRNEIGVLPLGICPVFANLNGLAVEGIPEESDPCLDFTFFEVDPKITFMGFGMSSLIKIREFSPPFTFDKTFKASYSFCGAIKIKPLGKLLDGTEILAWDTRSITDLQVRKIGKTYIRFEPNDKEQFNGITLKGTSGAPIFDNQGRPVALVVGGSEEDGYVIGVRMDKAWELLLETMKGVLAPRQLTVNEYEKIISSDIYENVRDFRLDKNLIL